MVRYFGFLASRVCGEKLPQVYRALGMDKPEPVAKVVLCTNGETVPES
ncbi:putative transposase [Shigella flexneri K-1770]|nr:putative transposase [Shigella flexneri K-1770]